MKNTIGSILVLVLLVNELEVWSSYSHSSAGGEQSPSHLKEEKGRSESEGGAGGEA